MSGDRENKRCSLLWSSYIPIFGNTTDCMCPFGRGDSNAEYAHPAIALVVQEDLSRSK